MEKMSNSGSNLLESLKADGVLQTCGPKDIVKFDLPINSVINQTTSEIELPLAFTWYLRDT